MTPNEFYVTAFWVAFKRGLCFDFEPNHSLENNEYVKQMFSSNCNHKNLRFVNIIRNCISFTRETTVSMLPLQQNVYKFTPQKIC